MILMEQYRDIICIDSTEVNMESSVLDSRSYTSSMFPCLRELIYKCYSFTTKKEKKSVLLEQMEIYTQTDLISFHCKIIKTLNFNMHLKWVSQL